MTTKAEHKHRCRAIDTCAQALSCEKEGDACPRNWVCQYHQKVDVSATGCPWCYGGGWYLSAAIDTENGDKHVRCGYCKGTGKREVWTTHPEYLRQHAERSDAPPKTARRKTDAVPTASPDAVTHG